MSIVFIGSQVIGHDCLLKIIKMKIKVDAVFTFKPDTHENWEKSVDSIAIENKIPLYFSNDLTFDKIKKINPELIVVVGYRKLFSNEILKIPKFGVVGLHASLLPHLRGNAPLNWAIINGDKRTGITMFFMNEKVDCGDIIAQKEIPIDNKDTIIDLKRKVQKLAVLLIEENIDKIFAGNVKRIIQSEKGTYGCTRIPEDGKINWNSTSLEIYNLIRSSEPEYAAFTFLNDKKLFIKKAGLVENQNIFFGMPGQVAMTLKNGNVLMITGDGVLKIERVNLEHEKEVDAKVILNSSKIRLV